MYEWYSNTVKWHFFAGPFLCGAVPQEARACWEKSMFGGGGCHCGIADRNMEVGSLSAIWMVRVPVSGSARLFSEVLTWSDYGTGIVKQMEIKPFAALPGRSSLRGETFSVILHYVQPCCCAAGLHVEVVCFRSLPLDPLKQVLPTHGRFGH